MANKYAVIFACDHNYIWPALIAANALVKAAGKPDFDVRICSTTFVPDGLAELCEETVSAEVISMGDFIPKTGVTDRFSLSTFACLFAIEKIHQDYERVLYLDADISVRNADLALLWNADMGSKPIAAVKDSMVWKTPRRGFEAYMVALGCSAERRDYFNSGCILVDCKRWKSGRYCQKILELLDEHPHLCKFHDQSAFNAVFAQNWAEISYLWNWQLALKHNLILIETRDPHIVHFNLGTKPWDDPARLLPADSKIPFVDLFDKGVWPALRADSLTGKVKPRKEAKTLGTLRKLHNTLPEYLLSVSAYLNRTDFIDFDQK